MPSITIAKLAFVIASLSSLAACGGVVHTECDATGKTTGTLQIVVPSTYATAQVVILGDCRDFKCAKTAGAGCTLWQGKISTESGASCRVTLVEQGSAIETVVVDGSEACGTTAKKVVVGDGAPTLR